LMTVTANKLDAWIMAVLQPSTDFCEKVKMTVRQICEFLKEDCFLKSTNIHVHKTVKGGSAGKGTALRNNSDADVVLFLSCFSSYQQQKQDRKRILDLIKKRLHDCRQCLTFTVGISEPRYKGPGNTPRSLSLTLYSKEDRQSMEVDILPAYDALGQVRRDTWQNAALHERAYVELLNANFGPGEFSPCFTELQKKFVKRYPAKLKSLLRLVKHWYKEVRGCSASLAPTRSPPQPALTPVSPSSPQRVKPLCSTKLPPKYALELLTIYAWEQGTGSRESFNTAEGFRTVLQLLCRYRNICIYWETCYSLQHSQIGAHVKGLLRKDRPIILDPADPTGILGQGDKWDLVAQQATCDLSLPCVIAVQAWAVQPAKAVTIEVKQLSGTSQKWCISPDTTISQVKEKIEQEWDIPSYRQRLAQQEPAGNNPVLQDGKTLADYGIFYSTTLLLLQTEPQPMEVFVKDDKNRTTTYRVYPTDTVRQLKEMICKNKGPHPNQQHLTYGSRELEDRHTLAHYNVQPRTTIYMLLRLRGGTGP
ncbi:OASL2 protein, partial [Chionis minor]|nr:OASL2 protein [Chionis minor]